MRIPCGYNFFFILTWLLQSSRACLDSIVGGWIYVFVCIYAYMYISTCIDTHTCMSVCIFEILLTLPSCVNDLKMWFVAQLWTDSSTRSARRKPQESSLSAVSSSLFYNKKVKSSNAFFTVQRWLNWATKPVFSERGSEVRPPWQKTRREGWLMNIMTGFSKIHWGECMLESCVCIHHPLSRFPGKCTRSWTVRACGKELLWMLRKKPSS